MLFELIYISSFKYLNVHTCSSTRSVIRTDQLMNLASTSLFTHVTYELRDGGGSNTSLSSPQKLFVFRHILPNGTLRILQGYLTNITY